MSHDAYSALSDATRRRILETLRGGPRPVGELVTELQVSQPTVSKHLKVLRDAGMVGTRAQGQKRFYSLTAQPLAEVVDWLEALIAAAATAQGEQVPQGEQAREDRQAQQAEAVAPRPIAAPAAETGSETSETAGDAAGTDDVTSRVDDEAAGADDDGAGADEDMAGVDDVAHEVETDGPTPETATATEATPDTEAGPVTAETDVVTLGSPAENGEVADDVADEPPHATPAPTTPITDAAPLRGEPDERALPWFTAQVTEITGTDEDGVVDPVAEEVAEKAGTGETARESAASDADRDAVDAVETHTGEGSPEPEDEPEQGESQVTGDTLDTDVHSAPAAQPEAEDDAEPRDAVPRTVSPEALTSENAEQLRPRGGAHRRQSGLLSTLTGLRRRGRGARRD